MLSKFLVLASLAMNINGDEHEPTQRAVSVIVPNHAENPSDNMIFGTFTLEQIHNRHQFDTQIHGNIIGLDRDTVYGLNIHQFGDISGITSGAIDCATTGPFDPQSDLGEEGKIVPDVIFGFGGIDITLPNHDLNRIIGQSFVVHELEDDGTSRGRVACGVIGTSSPKLPIDEEPKMDCIFQRSNVAASEFLTESAALGREIEGGAIRCRQWIITEETGFDCDGECVSIEITNPNPRFDHQYLSDSIVDGELSDLLRKTELWTMSLVNPVGLVQYVLQNQQTKQFLCADLNGLGQERLLQFESSGDSERCHWEFGQSQI